MQDWIVYIIIGVAALCAATWMIKKLRGNSKSNCSSGCPDCPLKDKCGK